MIKSNLTPKAYKKFFIARLRTIREGTGMRPREFASELGIPYDRYVKYERRSLLPLHLIERVCEITHVDCWFLITGRGTRSKGQEPVRKTG